MSYRTNTATWDATSVVRDRGSVTIRELSQHTTEIVRTVVAHDVPVLVTRHGVVVAKLLPTTLRAELSNFSAGPFDLDHEFRLAAKEAENGELINSSELP